MSPTPNQSALLRCLLSLRYDVQEEWLEPMLAAEQATPCEVDLVVEESRTDA